MWLTFWKEIGVEGLCLVNKLLSCEVCDEQFEKKSGLMNHMLLVHLIASPVNVAVSLRVEWETLYKDSCLWMQCSCGVWINKFLGLMGNLI